MKDHPADPGTWSTARRRWDEAVGHTNAVAKRYFERKATKGELDAAFEREQRLERLWQGRGLH